METSLKADEMIGLGTYILANRITNVEQERIPYNDLYKNSNIKGSVLIWDKEPTIERLHKFIFE
jgi:hypothetical protein